MGKIKIIGGTHRSRVLEVLDSDGLRPTLGRVRETVFNWLGQDLTGKRCVDLFAGSGALGLEAVSRNAKSVVFVEKNRLVAQQLTKNLSILKVTNAQLLIDDALSFMHTSSDTYDVIFIDPPYGADLFVRVVALLANIATSDSLIYLEYDAYLDGLDQYLRIVKQAKAGNVTYGLYQLIIMTDSKR